MKSPVGKTQAEALLWLGAFQKKVLLLETRLTSALLQRLRMLPADVGINRT